MIGEVHPWPAERAAASIAETLSIMWHGALLLSGDLGAERVPDEPITITATDLGRTWQVSKGPDDFIVDRLDAVTDSPASPPTTNAPTTTPDVPARARGGSGAESDEVLTATFVDL